MCEAFTIQVREVLNETSLALDLMIENGVCDFEILDSLSLNLKRLEAKIISFEIDLLEKKEKEK